MGRLYTVQFNNVAITAVQDLIQLEAKVVNAIIHKIVISQRTDVGDAEAESLLIRLKRVTDVVTNDLAEVKLDPGDAAANANLAVNETTQLVTGAEVIHAECWNIALPFVFLPPPELRPVVKIDDTFVVDLATAPADSITVSGVLYFEESGA